MARTLHPAFALTVMALAAGQALAQSAAPEVTISATRRAEAIRDVPVAAQGRCHLPPSQPRRSNAENGAGALLSSALASHSPSPVVYFFSPARGATPSASRAVSCSARMGQNSAGVSPQ